MTACWNDERIHACAKMTACWNDEMDSRLRENDSMLE
jgi:hypothetical protein